MKEFFKLLWINLVVKKRNFIEYIKIISRYYPKGSFARADFALILTYLFDNPFSISRRFLMQKGDNEIYQYGETPLTTLDFIIKKCDITSSDKIYELGCGRGRTSFWLSQVLGAETVGVEYIPEFVERADRITKKCALKRVSFLCQDMKDVDFQDATCLYLYGTCLTDEFIQQLTKKIEQLPRGTKIITVSFSLVDYANPSIFEVMRHFSAPFTWGEADVYLQVRK